MNTHVKLRPMTMEDQEMVMNWRTLPHITRFMNTDPVADIEKQKAWFLKQQSLDTSYQWVIEYDGTPIGVTSITEINRTNGTCTRGTYIAAEGMRSFETITAIYATQHDFVFDTLKLNKIEIQVFKDNRNVVKLNKLCGFQEEGILREHVYKNGSYHDIVNLGLLKSDWLLKKETWHYDPVELITE